MQVQHRLKTYIWVQSQQRYCERNNLPIYILKKGHLDAGVVIIKINLLDGRCKIFSQITKPNGEAAWQSWSDNGVPVLEAQADSYIAKQKQIDPDIWIIEIEDVKGLFKLDEVII
jgi:GMP synthase (glutamine-hydrolysing)